jgi:AcrR family transcriptional regulator
MPKRNTKQLIIDSAIEAYAQYGYKATTCEELAKAVGIRPSALYKHYINKRAIYDAAIEQLTANAIAAACNSTTPASYFKKNPVLLFIVLHAAMAGGDDLATVTRLVLEPLAEYWDIEKIFSLAGSQVWEFAMNGKSISAPKAHAG